MKRIITHWTGGSYKANSTDKRHYHVIFEGDGKEVFGDHQISDNSSKHGNLKAGKYAAHTRMCNTDSIGLSLACMGGKGVTERNFGKYPMTEKQFEAMCDRAAYYCEMYKIPITNKTVLSHAEVQPNLGITQRSKWDYTVLPFKPELKGAKACGDYMRTRVQHYLNDYTKPKPIPQAYKHEPVVQNKPIPKSKPKPMTTWQRIKSLFGAK